MDPAKNDNTHIIENPTTVWKKVVIGLKFLCITNGSKNESINNTRPIGVISNSRVEDSATSLLSRLHTSSREAETSACLKMRKNFYVYYLKQTHSPEAEISKVKYLSIHDTDCTESEYNLFDNANKEKSLSYIEVPILQLSETDYEQAIADHNISEQETKKVNKSSEAIQENINSNTNNNVDFPLDGILQNREVQTGLCPCGLTFSLRVQPKIAGRTHKICFTDIRRTRSRSQQTRHAKVNLLNDSAALDANLNYRKKVKTQDEKVMFKSRGISTETNRRVNNKTQTHNNRILSKSVQTKPHLITRSVGVQKYLNKENNSKKTLQRPFNILYKKDAKDIKKNRQSQANVLVVSKESILDKPFEKVKSGVKLHVIGKINNIPYEIKSSDKRKIPKRNLMTLRSVKSDSNGHKYFNADYYFKNPLKKQENSKPREQHYHTSNARVNTKSTNSDSKSNKSILMNLRSVKSDFNGNKHVIADYYNNPLEKRKNIPLHHFSSNNNRKYSRNENYGVVSCGCTKSDINISLPRHRARTICPCKHKENSSPYYNNYTKQESGDWLENPESTGITENYRSKSNKNVRDKMYHNKEKGNWSENIVSMKRNKNFRNKSHNNKKFNKIYYPKIGSKHLSEITKFKRRKDNFVSKSHNDIKPKNLFHNNKSSGGWIRKLKKIRNKKYYNNNKPMKIEDNSDGWSKHSEPSLTKQKNDIGTRLKKIFNIKEKSETRLENVNSVRRKENSPKIKSYDKKIKYTEKDSENRLEHTEPARRKFSLGYSNHNYKHKKVNDLREYSGDRLESTESVTRNLNPRSKSYDKNMKYIKDHSDNWLENTKSLKKIGSIQNKNFNDNKRKKIYDIKENTGERLHYTESTRRNEKSPNTLYDFNKHRKTKYTEEDSDNWLESTELLKRRGNLRKKINKGHKNKTVHDTKDDKGNWLENTDTARKNRNPRSKSYDNNKRKKIKHTEDDSDDWLENTEEASPKRRGIPRHKIYNVNERKKIQGTVDDRGDGLEHTASVRRHQAPRIKSYDNNKRKKIKYTLENSDDWSENTEPHKRRQTVQRKIYKSNKRKKIYDTKDDRGDWLEYTESVNRYNNTQSRQYDNNERKKIKYTEKDSEDRLENTEPLKRRSNFQKKMYKGNKHKGTYDTEDNTGDTESVRRYQSKKNDNNKHKKIKYIVDDSDDWLESLKRKETRNKKYYNNTQKLNKKGSLGHLFQSTGLIKGKGKTRNKSYNKRKKILESSLGHNINLFGRNSTYSRLTEFNQQPHFLRDYMSNRAKNNNSTHKYSYSQGSIFSKARGKRKNAICDCPKKKSVYHNLCDAAAFSIRVMKNGLKCLYKKIMNQSYNQQRSSKKERIYTDYEKVLIKSFTCNKYLSYKYIRQQLTRITLLLCACVLLCPCILALELCRTWLF